MGSQGGPATAGQPICREARNSSILAKLFRRGAGFGPFVDHESGALDVDDPLSVLLAWDLGPEVRTQSSVPFSPQAELVVGTVGPFLARGRIDDGRVVGDGVVDLFAGVSVDGDVDGCRRGEAGQRGPYRREVIDAR